MVICPRCQAQNPDGVFQCERCGLPFYQSLPMQSAHYNTSNNNGQFLYPNNPTMNNTQYQNSNNGFIPNYSIPQAQQPLHPNKKEGKILVLSKYGLDLQPWQVNEPIMLKFWSASFLREWLNNEFYNSAFSSEEKKTNRSE